ncbi:ABC transporter transmembrane domain-containing protein [Amycolatopsis magusensis]|uniref:ABC-type multidrug transport system fused ATPase/permease subunit n=1 Tax=Amycolatopsis magusensis TaxID=882444 RepID=A0ABS4PRK9_9PSEU|nr:ABC transporter ATP-binding protein [Amycolatopsis magusensis]MBP2182054.1 ABC-type multidrug transport system fused ATPase/permease subunit [Amycolatopsis magusensis]
MAEIGPGTPDARSPARYLWWLVRSQPWRAARGSLYGSVWMVSTMLPPYFSSRAVDNGLRTGDFAELAGWTGAVLAAALFNAVLGLMRHRTMTFVRMDSALRTVRVVVRHVARLGSTLSRRVSAGEVAHIGAADITTISLCLTIVGPGVGALFAFAAVTLLLLDVSAVLALVVLVGVPLLAVTIVPLLKRLQRNEAEYRERQGELTSQIGDIVGGLKVLRGIGGSEQFSRRFHGSSRLLRDDGYRVGAVTSWVKALTTGMPVLFLAVVTWLTARMTAAGEISIGEMVAVYGYVAALVIPMFFLIEGSDQLARGLVAARRVTELLRIEPEQAGGDRPGPDSPANLADPGSGLVVPPGVLLAVVSASPADSAATLDRLGRYTDSAATWNEVPLADIRLDEIRRRILVARNEEHLFAGSVREAVATRPEHDDAAITAAVRAAAAEDVAGLDARLEARGANLSGGQQQRLRLARALLADPEVLLLVEPASAVDAPTEALIAARLREFRAGRTTVVATTSPLQAGQADLVAFLVDGRVVATGTHTGLLESEPRYRALVYRGAEEEVAR